MKKDNFLVVVSILEGRKFPHGSPGRVLTAEAKFDGQTMVTDPVSQTENPNFTQELAWPVDSRALHQHKLQRSSVKLIIYSVDPTVGNAGREEIGYIVLNMRSAQKQKVYNWYPLLNTRQKGCTLHVGLYVDEDGEDREEAESHRKDTAMKTAATASAASNDPRQFKLISASDSIGRYFQLGPVEANCRMFVLSVTIDNATNLLPLVPSNVALPSMPYFFYYSLFGNDVTTKPFDDLLSPIFNPQQAAVRLLSSPGLLRQFLSTQPPLEVHLFCGDQLLGSCSIPVESLVQQPLIKNKLQPATLTDFYRLHPPKTSKLALPSIVPEEGKPRVRISVALLQDASSGYLSPVSSSPLTIGGRVRSDQPEAGENVRTAAVIERTRPTANSDVQTGSSPQPQRRSSHDDSYSATFESHSHMENDAMPAADDRVVVADAKMSGSSGEQERNNLGRSDVQSVEKSKSIESSSTSRHQLLVPSLTHHFNFSVDLRRVANFGVSHPVHIYVRYTYLFFGTTEAVVSHPPVEVRRGTEVIIPQSSCTFPFAATPQHLQETFNNIPLIVEVWQRDHQRSENVCIGTVKIPLSVVLRSPRTKITNAQAGANGTRQTWTDWMAVLSTSSNDRRLGDIEVMLSLEDLGPIVQPTVIVDCEPKSGVRTSSPPPPQKQPVDVRDTLEYKKAVELQMWMEEQQALYKAQEQQRLKALDEEFHRKLAIEVKKGAEYERLAEELRSALTSLEKREKLLKASEEQVERFRQDLQHKHTREMEKLRDASVRLKEEYEHKMELERIKAKDLEEVTSKLKRQLSEAEAKIQQQMRDFETYKNQLHSKPEVRLQAEINLLTLEKVELEKKLDTCAREKTQYKQQLERALSKLASLHKKEKDTAKAQVLKEKRELEHMRLRYLAAEEKKVINSERKELEELKHELSQLRETTQRKPTTTTTINRPMTAADQLTAGYNSDDELDAHIVRLIEERDSLLRTGVYNRDDRIVSDLDHQIREAQSRQKSQIVGRLICEEVSNQLNNR